MSRVFWDTMLFVYLFEGTGERKGNVRDLRERMIERRDTLYTSSLTLGELLVKPLETGHLELVRTYEETLSVVATVVDFDKTAARAYASIRHDRAIRAPDALQLACASAAGVDLFVTNDDRLSKKVVPGIQFIVSLDRVPL